MITSLIIPHENGSTNQNLRRVVTNSVVADERGEAGGLEFVEDLQELGAEEGIHCSVGAAREQTHLQNGADCRVLLRLYIPTKYIIV